MGFSLLLKTCVVFPDRGGSCDNRLDMLRIVGWLAGMGVAAVLGGCAGAPMLIHSPEVIRQHVIAVDGTGQPHDPMDPEGTADTLPQFGERISGIFSAMDQFHQKTGSNRILVFVHGGLNSWNDSLIAADSEMNDVMNAGYYPIFINWNSDLLSTYGEHLTSITQGETDDTWGRKILTPMYLLADLGRAATRMPIVWLNQLGSDLQAAGADLSALKQKDKFSSTTQPAEEAENQRWAAGDHGQALARTYMELRQRQQLNVAGGARKEIRVYIGPDMDVNVTHMAEITGMYFLTLPTKLVTQPIIDWLGTPAWQVMSRRTLMAFDGELGGNPASPDVKQSFVGHREMRGMNASDFSVTGAVEVFRERLQQKVSGSGNQAYDITLVGHSMGTMVLNEWLRRDLLEGNDPKIHHLIYSNIVYMAAACSVRDFGRSVILYLLGHNTTQFYNLMLHPIADLQERSHGWDLVPRGSLLVWLDDFLTEPQTPLDKTLGRWDNIISAREMIPASVRGQVTLKAFALAPYNVAPPPPGQPDYGPQEHGQFRGRPYWCQEFWLDEKEIIPGNDCRGMNPQTKPVSGN
jgi:hypothetical protein